MNHLLRECAPVPEAAWRKIEDEARRSLVHFLTAGGSLTSKDRSAGSTTPPPAARSPRCPEWKRAYAPSCGFRNPSSSCAAGFEVARATLDALDRGADDADLESVREAARRLAQAEDAIALGDGEFGVRPVLGAASPHSPISLGGDARNVPRAVAGAIQILRDAGVGGPYAVALGSNTYTGVVETTEMGGYPVLEHLRLIAGGPVLWSPTVDGAIVTSSRGGDARLTVGQDAAIGYLSHDDSVVRLYLEESLAFEVLTPQAAIRLTHD